MITTQSDIESKVISVVAKNTGLSPDSFKSHWQEPLTGRMFNLFAVDLIYILFEIEQEFSIRIPPEALQQYGFSSIAGICAAVQATLTRAAI